MKIPISQKIREIGLVTSRIPIVDRIRTPSISKLAEIIGPLIRQVPNRFGTGGYPPKCGIYE